MRRRAIVAAIVIVVALFLAGIGVVTWVILYLL